MKKKIEDNREIIEFSRFLATIKTDVPITLDEEQARREPVNEPELRRLFEELEFRSLLPKVLGHSPAGTDAANDIPRRASRTAQMSLFDQPDATSNVPAAPAPAAETADTTLHSIDDTPHTYTLIDTPEKRAALLDQLRGQTSVCFDTETTGVDVFFTADLVGMSFCWQAGEACFVPLPNDRAATGPSCRNSPLSLPTSTSKRLGKT